MPTIYGNVAGRNHTGVIKDAKYTRICPTIRKPYVFDLWEAELIEKWKRDGKGDDEIAYETFRPVRQIERYDPVRPNGRRNDA